MIRRTQSDDYLGPSRGWTKIMHKTVMLLLWPLRKPWWFLLILLILFLAPTFAGVKPAEVHLWYWNKIKTSSSEVKTIVADKTKEILPELPKIELPSVKVTSTAGRGNSASQVVDMPVKEVRRKSFEKASGEIETIDILKQENVVRTPGVMAASAPRRINASQTASQTETPVEKNKLALIYLETPKTIKGTVKVVNANEITLNNESIFLYGIYVNPDTAKGFDAKTFLERTVDGQTVECRIDAYTYQGIATAVCYIGKLNINRALVDNGYSQNVALD